jgi:hypothetical protein
MHYAKQFEVNVNTVIPHRNPQQLSAHRHPRQVRVDVKLDRKLASPARTTFFTYMTLRNTSSLDAR